MASKITDYPAKTAFNNGDLYDVSTFDGANYASEKMTFTQLKAELESSLSFINLYDSNGTLADARILDGGGFDLSLNNLNDFNVYAAGGYSFDGDTVMDIDFKRSGTSLFSFSASSAFNANMVIGTAAANGDYQLNLSGGTGGLVIPRMNVTNLGLITPIDGFMAYATDTDATFTSVGFWYYEASGWVKF